MENAKIKDWYMTTYPTDEYGEELNPTVTFEDTIQAMKLKECVYKTIGSGDSIVRERLFEKLAEIKSVEYSEIYNLWLS